MKTICGLCIGLLLLGLAPAQEQPQDDPVELAVGNEGIELGALIQLVSKRLSLNILYDEQQARQRVQLVAPKKVPGASLLGILQSVLRSRNLALVDGEVPTVKKIVTLNELLQYSAPSRDAREPDAANTPCTRVFALRYAEPKDAENVIKPFLSQSAFNCISIAEHRLLIVTDFAQNVKRVEQLLQWVDAPGKEHGVRFIPVRHLEAARIQQQVDQILAARAKTQGQTQPTTSIVADERTNQLIVVGPIERIAEIQVLAASLDVSLDLTTRSYSFQYVPPERIDGLVTKLIGELTAKRLYRSAIEASSNLLIVTTTPEIHKQVEQLKAEMDRPLDEEKHPVRFYKCYNATALEVLETIRAIEGEGATTAPATPESKKPASKSGTGFDAQGARVAVDPQTNTIIVSGPLDRQQAFEALIRKLDQRRPQVLVEVTILALDTSGGFSFGVELMRKSGSSDVLTFSSFGLSTPNTSAGSLTISPGSGFNGSIVDADIGSVIVRALETTGRARIVSTPRILVNDHATGKLSSVQQAPYTSTSQGTTTTTTTFGGFSSAGTTIQVVPHIGEGNHLLLEYSVELSSFQGQGSAGVPPPRQESKLESQVRIPNGHMVIAGGLRRSDLTESKSGVPILSHIPLLGLLFQSQNTSDTQSTLFVFIRPIILRDDAFRDLEHVSARDIEAAQLPPNFPKSEPILIPEKKR